MSSFVPIIVVVFFSFFLRLITLNLGRSPLEAGFYYGASLTYFSYWMGLSLDSFGFGWCTATREIWFSPLSPKCASRFI